jgi:hypothetical protein
MGGVETIDALDRTTARVAISVLNIAGTRSAFAYDALHGSLLQQPRKGGAVEL